MKLEVGEYYLSAGGEIVQIQLINKKESMYPYQSISGSMYMQDGRYFEDEQNEQDLIAHIPKKLHKHILNEINSYYTYKDFKEVVDSVWSDK